MHLYKQWPKCVSKLILKNYLTTVFIFVFAKQIFRWLVIYKYLWILNCRITSELNIENLTKITLTTLQYYVFYVKIRPTLSQWVRSVTTVKKPVQRPSAYQPKIHQKLQWIKYRKTYSINRWLIENISNIIYYSVKEKKYRSCS